jgi:hypothetical protein
MPQKSRAGAARNASEKVAAIIRRFLDAAREPVLIEPGEEQFRLEPGRFEMEFRNGRLTLQAWDERRNLARRVTGIGDEHVGRLRLIVEHFGKREGELMLLDRARAKPEYERHSARLVFREQFRRFLARQFPGWSVAELSVEANLQESLSPAFPRALLKRGASGWAALAAPPEAGAGAAVLTFGLIWLDYLRRRERRLGIAGLALFLPQAQALPSCFRLRFLNADAAEFLTFVYSDDGYEDRFDPRDYGNLDTRLEPCSGQTLTLPARVSEWVARLCAIPGVEASLRSGGTVSLRVRGLEFARAVQAGLLFGLERKRRAREADFAEVEALARELVRVRSAGAADHEHPLFRLQPEAWLESLVRPQVEQLEASLLPQPVYGQVPAFAGGDRAVMDLLAADRNGRLAVLELKATEDIHLPLQALDYWMRVQWHLERGEFSANGYFAGIALRREWPRLLLVAPALQFHPKTETVLAWFAPGIEVERIGLGAGWRQELNILFRLRGAERPF